MIDAAGGPGAPRRAPPGPADQLAALMARAAYAPTGLIQFTEENRLLRHGISGLDADTAANDGLAQIVITSCEPLILEDLRYDPRAAGRTGAYLGHPIHDQTGAVLGVCAVFDLAPRPWKPEHIAAVAEAAQVGALLIPDPADRQLRFRDAVLDNLHDGIAACDPDGTLVLVNSRMRQWWEAAYAVPGPDDDGVSSPLFRALRGERLRNEELVLRGRSRGTRHYLVDAQPIVGPDGGVLGAVQAVQDVTRQRRAERFRTCELAVTTALAGAPSVEAAGPRVLEAVVSTLDWAHAELWLVDSAAEVVRAVARGSGPGWEAGITVPDVLAYGQGLAGRAWQVGKPLWIRDVGRPQSLISPRTAASSGLHTALAIPVRPGLEPLGVLTAFTDSVEDAEGEVVALMSGIAAHIGEFVEGRLVEDLQRQLARSKDEYLALIGHELRTPLTSISACTEILRDTDPAALVSEGPRLLEVIERNTNQLRHIVNELLELSALDTGHAAVQLAPVDLAEVVRESVRRTREAVHGDPLTIEVQLPDELVLPGDGKRLRQIVDNLLANAVRYSPDGGQVSITLRVAGRAAELAVSDTGTDVTADEREKMFAGRYRTSRARDQTIPGTGLGLTLSRAVVHRHHGTIELTGHDGPGTTVVVRLPLDVR